MHESSTFSQVIAKNVKRLRGDFTMDELASAAKTLGVNWSSGNISAIEHGKVRPTLQNFMILTYALGKLHGRKVRPLELLESTGMIQTGIENNVTWTMDIDDWWTKGNDPLMPSPNEKSPVYASADIKDSRPGQTIVTADSFPDPEKFRVSTTDERIAKSIEMDALEFRIKSYLLWNHSFETERDRLAGEGSSAQKKGRVTRELKEWLLKGLEGDGDGSR